MHSIDLNIKSLTKVEGHATLHVKARNGKVLYSRLGVSEESRFFEQMVLGKHFQNVPEIVSRICGFCSTNHLLTAIEAIEKTFKIEVSKQTNLMRKLLLNGTLIRSHALHLYFLSLPDYFGKESALEFDIKQHEEVHRAMRLKKASSQLIKAFGGRIIHPITAKPGGFTKIPDKTELNKTLKELRKARKDAIECVKLFASFEAKCEEYATDYVALTNKDYSFLQGEIQSSRGLCIPEEHYLKYLKEFVVPYSAAKEAEFEGMPFFVGALSRINLNSRNLHSETKKIMKENKVKFRCFSPFYNNVAQAVEILNAVNQSIEWIKDFNFRNEGIPKIKPRKGEGIGVTEAPRGTLFHRYKYDSKGVCKFADIVVPTSQNLRNLNKDIKNHLQELLGFETKEKEIKLELEKLIRAYDPCFSCSTHFLEIKWE